MAIEKPDWLRLQKALAIEAEQGFTDLVGRQYRFSEFLCLTFGKFPSGIPNEERDRWQQLAAEYADYPSLDIASRQSLVAQTRRYIHQFISTESGVEVEKIATPKISVSESKPNYKTPNAKSPIGAEISRRLAPGLNQKISELSEIGPRQADKLARLGLYTVRDLLYYFPRDHIDYARQVRINELQAGETVTIVATSEF